MVKRTENLTILVHYELFESEESECQAQRSLDYC